MEATIATFQRVAPQTAPAEPTIQAWLIANLAEQLDLDPWAIDIHEPFDSYGLGSTEAVLISGDLEKWLSRELSATLLWDFPTIRQLAQHLARAQDD